MKPLPSTSRILSPSKQEFRDENRNWQDVNDSAKVHGVHTQGQEQVCPKTESSLHLRQLNLSAYISREKDYSWVNVEKKQRMSSLCSSGVSSIDFTLLFLFLKFLNVAFNKMHDGNKELCKVDFTGTQLYESKASSLVAVRYVDSFQF